MKLDDKQKDLVLVGLGILAIVAIWLLSKLAFK